jgi:hypothetical protein
MIGVTVAPSRASSCGFGLVAGNAVVPSSVIAFSYVELDMFPVFSGPDSPDASKGDAVLVSDTSQCSAFSPNSTHLDFSQFRAVTLRSTTLLLAINRILFWCPRAKV